MGIEPTLPARAAALQAAWRPTARPKAVNTGFRRSSTGGIRTHTHQGLSLVATASWRTVPHNPEPSVGIEPTRPSYQDGKLPLHHKGLRRLSTRYQERPAGFEPAPQPWQGRMLPLAPRARSYINRSPTVRPAGVAPARPLWKSGVLLLHHRRFTNQYPARDSNPPGRLERPSTSPEVERGTKNQWKRWESNPR